MNNPDIVVVEDDPEDRRVILSVLARACPGTRVATATDGAKAIDLLVDSRRRPKFVLLDLKLPKVSGIEVLRKLRSDPEAARVPIVILTSSRENADLERAYSLGANSYLCKPIEHAEFDSVVAQVGHYWNHLNEIAS